MELLGQNKIDHHQRQVAILSQDSFYKVLTPEQKAKAQKGQFNFDHPGINPARLVQCWRNHPSTVCTSSQMHDHSLLSWTFIIYTLLIICIVGHIWVFKFDKKNRCINIWIRQTYWFTLRSDVTQFTCGATGTAQNLLCTEQTGVWQDTKDTFITLINIVGIDISVL